MSSTLKYLHKELSFNTSGKSLYEITEPINTWINSQKISQGHLIVFIQHTSASLIIQENTSKDVIQDILNFFHEIVPENQSLYNHTIEGKDDMPAHIKSLLTQTSITIPIIDRKLNLGTWQGVFLFEHRKIPMIRKLNLSFIGE